MWVLLNYQVMPNSHWDLHVMLDWSLCQLVSNVGSQDGLLWEIQSGGKRQFQKYFSKFSLKESIPSWDLLSAGREFQLLDDLTKNEFLKEFTFGAKIHFTFILFILIWDKDAQKNIWKRGNKLILTGYWKTFSKRLRSSWWSVTSMKTTTLQQTELANMMLYWRRRNHGDKSAARTAIG